MSQDHAINKNIYILWLQGFDEAPDVVKLCLRSWQVHNPGWTIHQIDNTNLDKYIELDDIIKKKHESKTISNTSLSDVIRLQLLRKFGGLWVDATTFCTRPLDDWIGEYIQNGFFAYAGKPKTELIVGSWFLYAEQAHYLVEQWYSNVLEYCKTASQIGMSQPRLTYQSWRKENSVHYFWMHYIFKELYDSDSKFQEIWDSVPKLKADDAHDIPNSMSYSLNPSSKIRIDSRYDSVYKFWSPNRVEYPRKQDSVYQYVRTSLPHHTYILIAYHESKMGRDNLQYLLDRTELRSDRTICIIANGTMSLDIPENIRVIQRENKGYDFGAWGYGISELQLPDVMNEDDRVIMINSSVRGPYLESDIYRDWVRRLEMLITPEVKLGGISINCLDSTRKKIFPKIYDELGCEGVTLRPYVPHVQSMLMVTDLTGLRIGLESGIFNGDTNDRFETIARKEMRYSIEILRNSYNINCILPKYRDLDYRKVENQSINSNNNNNSDPWWNQAYFNQTIDPYQAIFIKTNHAINYYHLVSIDYKNMGLMNQIMTIINGLLDAKWMGNFKVLLSHFRPDYRSNDSIPISDVLDLRAMNNALNMTERFPEILDISKCDIKYRYSTYGTTHRHVMIDQSVFPIHQKQNINKLLTDPHPFKEKELRITFDVNGVPYTKRIKEKGEYISEIAHGDTRDLTNHNQMGWYDRKGFSDILKILRFDSRFYEIAQTLLPSDLSDLNVIHLRIEDDGISHWAKQNKMDNETFRTKLESLYLFYTRLLILPGQKILILTGDPDAGIVQLLRQEYEILTLEPTDMIREKFGYTGRELNAIVDFIAGQLCQNVFIGCHSLKLKRGSTFSYFLHQTMNNALSLLLDLDDLSQPAEIITK